MKNVVFIVDITLEGSQRDVGRWAETRSDPYEFAVKAWGKWCDKNNCELFVLNEEVLPHSTMPVSWQRYYVFDLLEANEIEYDQVMYVDADTIPHPDCPNVFEMSDRKFCFVHNEGSYDWILTKFLFIVLVPTHTIISISIVINKYTIKGCIGYGFNLLF